MASLQIQRRPEDLGIEQLADSLEKPLLDDREYRVIRLSNALEALLIHDPDTDKASAAMDVDVGSFSDPEDMPGMAHAIEHLLFMGTEKVCHSQAAVVSNTKINCCTSIPEKTTTMHI